MGQMEDGKPEIKGEVNILGDLALRQEFVELNTRYRKVVEKRDVIGELVAKCHLWISEQKNFEEDEFLKCMVLAFFTVCQEKLLQAAAELQEIQPRIQALQVRVANRSLFHKAVNHDSKMH